MFLVNLILIRSDCLVRTDSGTNVASSKDELKISQGYYIKLDQNLTIIQIFIKMFQVYLQDAVKTLSSNSRRRFKNHLRKLYHLIDDMSDTSQNQDQINDQASVFSIVCRICYDADSSEELITPCRCKVIHSRFSDIISVNLRTL